MNAQSLQDENRTDGMAYPDGFRLPLDKQTDTPQPSLVSSNRTRVRRLGDWAAGGICRVGYTAVRLRAISIRRAYSLFLLARKLHPHDVVALRFSAWCLREMGDLNGAVVHYEELLKIVPSFVEGRVEFGFVLSSLERYSEALEQFEQAQSQSPGHTEARRGLAAMLIVLNHGAEALPVCEELVRDDPSDAVAWGFLGRARFDSGQWNDALAAYERTHGLQWDPLVALEHASLLSAELNRHADAEGALTAALGAYPDDRMLRIQLASRWWKSSAISTRRSCYTRFSKRIPQTHRRVTRWGFY
jgi:tetratricopeptide (TPR) repeat protein